MAVENFEDDMTTTRVFEFSTFFDARLSHVGSVKKLGQLQIAVSQQEVYRMSLNF